MKPALIEQVTTTVSRTILQNTGRAVHPALRDDLLARGRLEPHDVPLLALALQQQCDVEFEARDLNGHHFGSIESICALIERRRR